MLAGAGRALRVCCSAPASRPQLFAAARLFAKPFQNLHRRDSERGSPGVIVQHTKKMMPLQALSGVPLVLGSSSLLSNAAGHPERA